MPNAPLSPDTRAILAAIERVHADTQAQISVLTQEIERLKDAFPDGKTVEHRLYHERVMDRHYRWDKMKHSLMTQFLGWGGLGLIGWVLYALVEFVKAEIKK